MGLLTTIFNCLAGFAAGFLGHVVAHDFCEVTPMMSRKIIEAAASLLPASIRDRYSEEWRADLADQPGALAKMLWSIGCFRSVFNLRRQWTTEFYEKAAVEFVLSTGTPVFADWPTFEVVRSIGIVGRHLARHKRWLPHQAIRQMIWVTAKLQTFKWRKVGQPDYRKASLLIEDITKNRPRKIAVWHDGVLLRNVLDDVTVDKN